MMKIVFTPGALPLGGVQLDSILVVEGQNWHRTTDPRPNPTAEEIIAGYESHRFAFKKALDAAFDAAIAELRGRTEETPKVSSVPGHGTEKPQTLPQDNPADSFSASYNPQPTASMRANGIGGVEGGSVK